MLFGDIEEKDKYQSEVPSYSLGYSPSPEPTLTPQQYGYTGYVTQGDGHMPGQDSFFLAPAVTGNTMGAQAQVPSGPSYRERVAAYFAGQNPYQVHDEKTARADITKFQRQQAERTAMIQGLDIVGKLDQMQPEQQKYVIDMLKKKGALFTGSEDSVALDLIAKAKGDQRQARIEAIKAYIEQHPEMGLKGLEDQIANDPNFVRYLFQYENEAVKARAEAAFTQQISDSVKGLQNRLQGTTESPTAPSTPAQPSPSQGAPAQPQGQSDYRAPRAGGGTVADRHNNPLNIKIGGATQHWISSGQAEPGQAGQDGGRFIKFNSPETGFKAAQQLLTGPVYANLPLDAAMRKWSGNGYGADVAPGLSPTMRVKDLTPDQLQHLTQSMAKREGYSGRPITQAVQSQATPAESQELTKLGHELKAYDEWLQANVGLASNEKGKRVYDEMRALRDATAKNMERIENRYDKQKPTPESQRAAEVLFGKPWPQLSPEEKQEAIAKSSTIAAAEAGERAGAVAAAEAPGKIAAADAANANRYLSEGEANSLVNTTDDGPRHPVNMTREQLSKEMKENPNKWKKVTPLATSDNERILTNINAVEGLDRVLKLVDDPQVARLIGNMLSNPTGSYQVALQKVFGNNLKNVPPQYLQAEAEIADVTSLIRHARIGGAQAIHEVKNLQPLLASLADADAPTVKTKLRVLRNNIARAYNTELRGHQARGRDVDPNWKEFEILAGVLDEPAQATPAEDKSNPLAKWKKK